MDKILYKAGYKYQLAEPYTVRVSIQPAAFIFTPFIRLDVDGTLYITAAYAWDGPSGPTVDTKNFMRGSLVHDALYQLMRQGHLSQDWREAADQELRRLCIEDGMSSLRAWWVYQGVRFGGGPAAMPSGEAPLLGAP